MTLRMRRLAGPAALLAAVLATAGCGSAPQNGPQDEPGELTVVASTDVWADVVRAVTGDTVHIETIIDDPAADPHAYEASPADAAQVQGADLVVFNGGGYDEFVEQFLEQSPDTPSIEAYLLLPDAPDGDEHADEQGSDEHADEPAGQDEHGHGEGPNEHVWYDLPVVQQVAQRVAEELGRLDPARAGEFTDAAATFRTRLDGLRDEVAGLATAHGGDPVAMTEPVAYYLVQAAGLKDLTPPEFSEAIEEETDPPAAAVAATRTLMTGREVRALIYNPQAETPVTSQVRAEAESAGIPVVEMTETLPEGKDYVSWMSSQVTELSAALSGR